MTTFTAGVVEVEVLDGLHPFHGKPIEDRNGGDRDGEVALAKLTTPDGFVGRVGVTSWPGGEHDQRLIDFFGGPDAYRRLERAGNMSLNRVPGGVVAVLRVLKYTDRELATLHSVGWEQLDPWIGASAADWLIGLGAVKTGAHGELRPEARRFTADPAILVDPALPTALFAAYALTRALPLALDYGKAGLEALD